MKEVDPADYADAIYDAIPETFNFGELTDEDVATVVYALADMAEDGLDSNYRESARELLNRIGKLLDVENIFGIILIP